MNLTKENLKDLSETRLKEARVLYDNGFYDGAKYLIGYVVETALKAIICNNLNYNNFPPRTEGELKKVFFTHNIDSLVVLGGVESELEERKDDTTFRWNWSIVKGACDPTLRYSEVGSTEKTELDELFQALEQPEKGILNWLREKW